MNIPIRRRLAASIFARPVVAGSRIAHGQVAGSLAPAFHPKAGGGAALKVGAMTFGLFTDHGANWIPLESRTRTPGGWERSALDLPAW